MLTLSKALNASQAQTYHKMEFTSDSQRYYQQAGTAQGVWQGQLAEKFGLAGEVKAEDFALLSEGKHPQTGEELVKHRAAQEYTNPDGTTTKAVEHRAGWDATFSAPKSVSLTALVGGDERVREAHRAAVTFALAELERYTQARIGGNNSAETTGKFIAAKFEHDTARPVDGYAAPQLHTHAVIFNVTERAGSIADGKQTRALQERALFESQNFATAVYQSTLTYQLRKLGYEIEPGKSGAPEIKGYSEAYLDASSLRSQQIREHLEKAGHSGPEAAQIAAHATRDGKQILTAQQVLAAHQEIAATFGNQAEKIVADAHKRARASERTQQQSQQEHARARDAVTYAKAHNFEREAVTDERVLLRDALRHSMGEATYDQVRAEFDARRNRGEFAQVAGRKHDSGRSFTTRETIANERANIAQVLEGQTTLDPMATKEQAAAQALRRTFLNPAQRTVIEEVLTTQDRVHGLQGLAGTGKTTTLQAIREGAERGGYTVEGFAPTSKAAGQLREAGIKATTLQSFLVRKQDQTTGDDARTKHLYMLDESSFASTRQMRNFLDKIKPQDRVLVIGDTKQHQGVDAGRPFEQMQDAGMRTSRLDRIMRQKDPELRKAVELLAGNQTVAGVKMLAEQGRVTEIGDRSERIRAIAKEYAAQPEGTLIVSPDNRSRQDINQAVRVELQAQGTLAKDDQQFSTLIHRSDMTGADRAWAARYQAGDVLQYVTGSKKKGIERGSFATVRSVHAKTNTLTVEREDGKSVTYDPKRLQGVNAYREAVRELATGERIQFTTSKPGTGIANRDLGTVTKIEPGQITVRMDTSNEKETRTITFDPAKMRHFDHGYAMTSHSSQGLTVHRVLAHIDTDSSRSLINTRLAYVAISRASDDARVYTNNATTLGERLATDISKSAAVDFRQNSDTAQLRQAVQVLNDKHTSAGVELLQQQGRIREYADPNHRLAAVATDYLARPERTIIVAPDRAERQELTQLIRADLQMQGKLALQSHSVSVLVEQEFGNRKLAANYAPGDLVKFRAGIQAEGIASGSLVTVVAVDTKKNFLTLETKGGDRVAHNPVLFRQQTQQSIVYRQEERALAVGERVQFTASDKEQGVRMRDFGTIERIDPNQALTIRLDNGTSVELGTAHARHIEHGYVVDGSKPVSADRVLITQETMPQLTQQEAALAAISQASRDVAIYTAHASSPNRSQPVVPLEQAPVKQTQTQPLPGEPRNIESPLQQNTTGEHAKPVAATQQHAEAPAIELAKAIEMEDQNEIENSQGCGF